MDHLHSHFGVPVPGVYVANNYRTALQYPIASTARPGYGGCKPGISGGTVIAHDGTYPMRCVLRCLALPTNQLWHSTRTRQSLFMPQHLYITHIIFHAVHPEICHQSYENHTFDETRCRDPSALLQTRAGQMIQYSDTSIPSTLTTMKRHHGKHVSRVTKTLQT